MPVDEETEQGGLFAPGPGAIDEVLRREQACASLLAASRVESPPLGDLGVGEGTVVTAPVDPGATSTAFVLMAVLNPDLVTGLPDLDRPDVRDAIDDERRAVEAVAASAAM